VCNILTAKRAEHGLLEAFGELEKVSKVEGVEVKMKAYLDMYNKPLSSQVIEALKALVAIEKSKVVLVGCLSQDDVCP
jgi:hypothetical protein